MICINRIYNGCHIFYDIFDNIAYLICQCYISRMLTQNFKEVIEIKCQRMSIQGSNISKKLRGVRGGQMIKNWFTLP